MFFDKLQQLCTQKGTSPSKVVTEIGMNKSAVTYWKSTGNTPKGDVLQKIADHLGVPVNYFFDDEQKENINITFDDFTYAMYNHSADLTDEEKKMLLEMAEFMKKKRGL